jgi:hypothetical protein
MLEPPPIRASAGETADTTGNATERTIAIACSMARARWLNFMAFSSIPGRGKHF